MAVTSHGEALTEAHQKAQRSALAAALDRLSRLWRSVDIDDPESLAAFQESVTVLLKQSHKLSGQATMTYLKQFSLAETGGAFGGLLLNSSPDVSPLVGSTDAYIRDLISRGVPPERIKRLMLAKMSGELQGRVLNGAREVLSYAMRTDKRVIGLQLVPSSSCCAFCAMVATRRVFRKSFNPSGGSASLHPHCKCLQEPMYSTGSRPTKNVRKYLDLWRNGGIEMKVSRNGNPYAVFAKEGS